MIPWNDFDPLNKNGIAEVLGRNKYNKITQYTNFTFLHVDPIIIVLCIIGSHLRTAIITSLTSLCQYYLCHYLMTLLLVDLLVTSLLVSESYNVIPSRFYFISIYLYISETRIPDKMPEDKMTDNPYPKPYPRPHPNRSWSSSLSLSLS